MVPLGQDFGADVMAPISKKEISANTVELVAYSEVSEVKHMIIWTKAGMGNSGPPSVFTYNSHQFLSQWSGTVEIALNKTYGGPQFPISDLNKDGISKTTLSLHSKNDQSVLSHCLCG